MISEELESCLHHAFVEARSKRHKYITIEHLLRAVLRDHSFAANILSFRAVNVEDLRRELDGFIERHTSLFPSEDEPDTQPTADFQRVIQRAILNVQSSGRGKVTSADVLLALLNEKSIAALLAKRGVTPLDVMNGIVSGPEKFKRLPTEQNLSQATDGDVLGAEDLQIVLFNDDFTPMEFVVGLLQRFLSMSKEDATEVMLEVHRDGRAVCGLYDRDAALAIVKSMAAYSREHGWPLRCEWAIPK
jgi:ATP-dependent Clp protease adapter protein ClpS